MAARESLYSHESYLEFLFLAKSIRKQQRNYDFHQREDADAFLVDECRGGHSIGNHQSPNESIENGCEVLETRGQMDFEVAKSGQSAQDESGRVQVNFILLSRKIIMEEPLARTLAIHLQVGDQNEEVGQNVSQEGEPNDESEQVGHGVVDRQHFGGLVPEQKSDESIEDALVHSDQMVQFPKAEELDSQELGMQQVKRKKGENV